jgi:hypothetical protein
MAEESQALVRFAAGWAEDGISSDGLPSYRETVRVTKSVPPFTEVEYEATEQDFAENPGPYQRFLAEQGARVQQATHSGFPLALWPVVSPAQFKALTARGVTTIEQLMALAGRRGDDGMPGEFKELAERAKQMLALSANLGKFEVIIRDRDGQIAALTEQVVEMRATISAQNSLINTMKMTAAPVLQPDRAA